MTSWFICYVLFVNLFNLLQLGLCGTGGRVANSFATSWTCFTAGHPTLVLYEHVLQPVTLLK